MKNPIPPLVDSTYLLQKFPGKGGWTYAEIPEIPPDKTNPFGWVTVRGLVDSFELKQYKLMPMGNGKLFLPVKAAVRKRIQKKAGDHVRITLYLDDSPVEIPTEILDCFQMEPGRTLKIFRAMTNGQQKAYLDWVYAAKTIETKTKRIVKMMQCISFQKDFYQCQKKERR